MHPTEAGVQKNGRSPCSDELRLLLVVYAADRICRSSMLQAGPITRYGTHSLRGPGLSPCYATISMNNPVSASTRTLLIVAEADSSTVNV